MAARKPTRRSPAIASSTQPGTDTDSTAPIRYARPWMGAFLLAFARHANISQAARAAKVTRRTVYLARDTDKAFGEGWLDALEEAADHIRAELHRRAIDGVEEPVFGAKGQIGAIRRYDSGLLARLAQAHCQEFKKEAAPTTVNVSVQITLEKLRQVQERRRASLARSFRPN